MPDGISFRRVSLHWIEEPLRADRPAHEWAQVAAAGRARLAAGENLRGAATFEQALRDGHWGFVQPDACKWGGVSGTLPVARAVLAAGKTYCPHFLGGAIGLLTSLHLLAAVRGDGLLEVDFNENPLRTLLLGDAFPVVAGRVNPPEAEGIGIEPDLAPLHSLLTLHTESRHGA